MILSKEDIQIIESNMLQEKLRVVESMCDNIDDEAVDELYTSVHQLFINHLLNVYVTSFLGGDEIFKKYFEGELSVVDRIGHIDNVEDIPHLCEEAHIEFLNTTFTKKNGVLIRKKSKEHLLEKGAVYTPMLLAYEIAKQAISACSQCSKQDVKILDFATGTGRFYRMCVKVLCEYFGIDADYAITNCMFAIDIDPIAINITRLYAFSLLKEKTENKLNEISSNIVCGNAFKVGDLLSKRNAKNERYNQQCTIGFDVIVSNPPYLVLKPSAKKMTSKMIKNIKSQVDFFKQSHLFNYSIEGMLNLYQLSIEMMLHLLKENGSMGVICPSTLFADMTASKLRKYLLLKNSVKNIKYFTESDRLFFNVTQATCIFTLTKGGKTDLLKIENGEENFNVSINDVISVFGDNMEIPRIRKIEWNVLNKIGHLKKIKEVPGIRNKRGELDLTQYKKFITLDKTPYRLVRGNMITLDGVQKSNEEYVCPEFLEKKSMDYRENDFGRVRLICPQISNQSQRVRLKFVECLPTDILGNSCNYISADSKSMSKLKLLLNSSLLNWRFKITSSNNHINNYEIGDLPIIDLEKINDELLEIQDCISIEKAICSLYGLTEDEANYIIKTKYDEVI